MKNNQKSQKQNAVCSFPKPKKKTQSQKKDNIETKNSKKKNIKKFIATKKTI